MDHRPPSSDQQPIPSDQPLATREDVQRLQAQIAELVKLLDRVAHDQQIQFTRIAQLQADLDVVRGAWNQLTPR